MDIHEITNGEVEFKHEGKAFKIKRLSLYELSYDVEKQVKEEYYANIQRKASMLTGKDKVEYLQNVLDPSDELVSKLSLEKSNTFRGRAEELMKILNKCQKVTMEEVETLMMDEKYWTLVTAIQNYALSGKLIKENEAVISDDLNKKK